MKLTLDPKALLTELVLSKDLFKFTDESKKELTHFGRIQLVAEETLTLRAFDPTRTFEAIIPAEIEEPGEVILSGTKFLAVIKAFSVFPSIRFQKEKFKKFLTITPVEHTDSINQMVLWNSVPELPTIDSRELILSCPADQFKQALEAVDTCTLKESGRYAFDSVLLEIKDKKAKLIATDGHQLRIRSLDATVECEEKSILIPSPIQTLVDLAKSAPKDGLIELNLTTPRDLMIFTVANRTLISRQSAGNFPDYHILLKSLPKSQGRLLADRKFLRDALRRTMLLSDSRSHGVKWTLAETGCQFNGEEADEGFAFNQLENCTYTGPNLKLSLNAEYLADFVSTAQSEKVVFNVSDDHSPIVGWEGEIAAKPEPDYMLMPMRI